VDPAELNALLRKLHAELHTQRTLDPRNRELIDQLAGDIRTVLDHESPAGRYHGLRDRLTGAAAAFEASHPKLGKAIENVVDALARLNL
jgi:hypothetical protein